MCPYKNTQKVNENLNILNPKTYPKFKALKSKENYFLLLGQKFASKIRDKSE